MPLLSAFLWFCSTEAPGLPDGLDPGFPSVHIKREKSKGKKAMAVCPQWLYVVRDAYRWPVPPWLHFDSLLLCLGSFLLLYLFRFFLC